MAITSSKDMSLDKMPIIWAGLPKELIEKFDVLDDQQITNATKGKIIEELFYEFPSHGENAVSLTYAGVKWIASMMASRGDPLTVVDMTITETEKSIKIIAKGRRYTTGEERFGGAEQSRFDGHGKDDPFAFAKAVSKAQRNVLKQFIPETVIQEAYKEWKRNKTTVVGSTPK